MEELEMICREKDVRITIETETEIYYVIREPPGTVVKRPGDMLYVRKDESGRSILTKLSDVELRALLAGAMVFLEEREPKIILTEIKVKTPHPSHWKILKKPGT